MTQNELNRAVARVTGESRGTIRDLGFILARQEPEPATEPMLAVDCPGCGAQLAINPSKPLGRLVECSRCDALFPYSDREIYVTYIREPELAARA
jgi:predicted Zn finger-like uncharacterized protein